MEITINIPDNLVTNYVAIILLVFSLLYLMIQLKNGNETKKLNDWLIKNKDLIKDRIDNGNNYDSKQNNNNNNNSNISNKNDDNMLFKNKIHNNDNDHDDDNKNNNNNNKNNKNNKNNFNASDTNSLLINNINNKEIEQSYNNNNKNNSNNNNNNNYNNNNSSETIAIPIISLNNSSNIKNPNINSSGSFDKSSLKLSLEQINNNNSTNSSEDEQVPASPVSNSFLSPLNFTTGKRKSQKNQFYYVSTYYSSCDLPNKIMDQNDLDDPLINEEIKSSELLNNGFKYKIENNLNSKNINNKSNDEKINNDNKNDNNVNINNNDNNDTDSDNNSTSNSNKSNDDEHNQSSGDNKSTSDDNIDLNQSINLLSSANLNNNSSNPISKSLNNFGKEGMENTLLSPNETCIKRLKKKKCILPQVLQLKWRVKPKKVLIIKKYNDETINELIPGLVSWLRDLGITIIKESEDSCDDPLAEPLTQVEDPYSIDFIISMGGDGTILHTSSLFKTYIPPILSFSLGSLGFLTAFDYSHHREYIQSVIDGKCFVSYRLRLSCTVVSSETQVKHRYQVLNEVTIDRGTNPYLSNLECCCDGKLITIVQADGLIIATSTGSTAYSLSAGGSLVHPTIPAILITPICPHTLSFRPVILPSTSELVIRVPETSRCPVWASFDGKNRQELNRGDFVIIKTSRWAVPVVCKTDESNEWFEKLAQNLNWNVRMVQKSFNPPNTSSSDSEGSSNGSTSSLSTLNK
ncbi:hypothetical protein DICPUDRAFT_155765 [Dictyostelium purpureum]|uniref:NAD+ kinase family protein n=1 Tax=Dictyostelium purpureum TaxID=5786 RepID=F0ZUU1_DICPU|nr:uncharacterized protein DICPUDRAFT_155765 [Dictyostelium purpureum]EGC32307.1 hypothetical protein DICPUDRAFT_155765 [Dictyostelium purpureum]|eukprot:XP_003291185.1 hypothetical protein DICPUDRAFT_155765 [Dictyostelium purpureum]